MQNTKEQFLRIFSSISSLGRAIFTRELEIATTHRRNISAFLSEDEKITYLIQRGKRWADFMSIITMSSISLSISIFTFNLLKVEQNPFFLIAYNFASFFFLILYLIMIFWIGAITANICMNFTTMPNNIISYMILGPFIFIQIFGINFAIGKFIRQVSEKSGIIEYKNKLDYNIAEIPWPREWIRSLDDVKNIQSLQKRKADDR